ncbi:MAG TPA: hypothetical protein VK716_18115 [Terracidiphilus sp.]|jgi:hypothetical protein|nr:hypothetical protein [Terracidiphilus sp.]
MNLLPLVFIYLGVVLVFWIASRMVISSADEGRTAKLAGGNLEFFPNRRAYWGVYLMVAIMLYPIGAVAMLGMNVSSETWPVLFCVGFILFLLTAYPGTIYLGSEGLKQTYWVGPGKHILWKEVREIRIEEKRNRITIVGSNGKKIVHTRQLPDKARYLAELESHCPAKMPGAAAKRVEAPVAVGSLDRAS